MDQTPKKTSRAKPRAIVGISLTKEMATSFKAEAKRRDMSLKALFVELWSSYEKSSRQVGE